MKVWTLVITDGFYMDVEVFYANEAPSVEIMAAKTEFNETAVIPIFTELRDKFSKRIKHNDYVTATYDDSGKKYLFHLKCHVPENDGKTVTGS